MKTDREEAAGRVTSLQSPVVTDSVVLDELLVSEALGHDPVDSSVFNCARGILNGVIVGFALWVAGLLLLAIALA